jgi:hypothetical protein
MIPPFLQFAVDCRIRRLRQVATPSGRMAQQEFDRNQQVFPPKFQNRRSQERRKEMSTLMKSRQSNKWNRAKARKISLVDTTQPDDLRQLADNVVLGDERAGQLSNFGCHGLTVFGVRSVSSFSMSTAMSNTPKPWHSDFRQLDNRRRLGDDANPRRLLRSRLKFPVAAC